MLVPLRWGTRAIVTAIVLALTLIAPAAGSAAPRERAAGEHQVVTGKRLRGWSARRAAKFWTPARMRSAQPVELTDPHGAGAGAADMAGVSKSIFEPVPDPTTAESRVHGVIFFEFLFGLARCSGTAVNGKNLSIVVTAGHCVNLGWPLPIWFSRRWAFVPGYRAGQHPFGVFPAKWLGSTQGWLSSGSSNSDVGIAVVGRNERGQRLGRMVGGAEIAWNLSPKQTFDVHGYPADKPFDGRTQRVCEGTEYLGHDPFSFLTPGPLNLAVDCRLTAGASGGAWTIRDNVVNSVTSYGYENGSATTFGPYFGKEVARLYRQAEGIK
jgi:V8-like Glu-specific endopeptidase